MTRLHFALNRGLRPLAWMLFLAVLNCCTAWPNPPALAQDRAAPRAAIGTDELTSELIKQRMKQVEESEEFTTETKAKLRDDYQDALRELEAAELSRVEAARYERDISSVDEDIRQAIIQQEALPRDPIILLDADADLSETQAALNQAEERLAVRKQELLDLRSEPQRRQSRIKAIPDDLKTARAQLQLIQQQLATSDPSDEPHALARRTFLLARSFALEARVDELEKEREAYDTTVRVLLEQQQLAADRVLLLQKEVGELRNRFKQLAREQVNAEIRSAKAEFDKAASAVKDLAERNWRLTLERAAVRDATDAIADELRTINNALENVTARRKRTEEKAAAVGLTNAVGQQMRKERLYLLDLRSRRHRGRQQLQGNIEMFRTRGNVPAVGAFESSAELLDLLDVQQVQQRLFELEDQRAELDDMNAVVRIQLRNKTSGGRADGAGEPDSLEAGIRATLERTDAYLEPLIADYNSYFDDLVELDSRERELHDAISEFLHFIDERVLWIRSSNAISLRDVTYAAAVFTWLADPAEWRELGRALLQEVEQNWFMLAGASLAFIVLILYRPLMKRTVVEIGERATLRGTYRFIPTLHALVLTVIIAATFPAVMWFVGWRLSSTPIETALGHAIGGGLDLTARVFLLLMLIRQTCRSKGLAGAHFGWTDRDLGTLRKLLRWLMLVGLPLTFIAGMFQAQNNPFWRNSVGRVCFVLAMLLFAIFMDRVLRPRRGLLYQVTAARDEGWLVKLRYVLYAVGVGAPLSVATLAVLGYYFTAFQLTLRLEATVWILFAALLTVSLLLRWLLVTRRWLAMRQSRRRQELQPPPVDNTAEGAPPPSQPTELDIDLTTVNVQTRQFLLAAVGIAAAVGLWAIWYDVFPAVGFMNEVRLWSATVGVDEVVTGPDGTVTTDRVERLVPVTLFNILIAVIVVIITWVAARNVAGLLQMSLLERLPLDAGVRFAVVTISRYVIVVVGVIVVCRQLGVDWSKVQWLVAALMVGLGFGLQEIFANFVSGLILLVERPIRVGDLVTVGNINGTVARIQMRATTIRDWNRRELVVPNKELVTGQLINWTLTDSTYRVDLPVGIAYGSNTELARDLLLKIAAEHPKVLDKPKPKSIFKRFGDSALEFELRIFIPHMDFWPRVVTEVNMAIDREFSKAGIVIAFPQRDIHIRTIAGKLPIETVELPRLQQPHDQQSESQAASDDGSTASSE